MKKTTKSILILYLINWAVILVGSLILDLFDNAFQYTVSPAILAIFSTLGILGSFGGSKDSKKSTKSNSTSSASRNNVRRPSSTIYVCKPLSTDIYYEVKDNKVYKHLTSKVVYEIKGDKIYRQFETKPILLIKGNKLYYPDRTAPAYRIDNNKVYEGDFGRLPILSLRSERDKFNPSK